MTDIKLSNKAERADKLDPVAEKVAVAAARLPQIEEGTPEQARAMRAERGNPFAPLPVELAETVDIQIPSSRGEVSARSYLPAGVAAEGAPCFIFYHGGGYVLSSVEDYDTITQRIAHFGHCRVISIDYELAPSNKIKSIHRDGYDVYRWVRENAAELGIDENRIAIGGDSAGGNLTVAITHACKRDNYPMPSMQVLIYPSVDPAMSFASIDEFAENYFLTKKGMNWFRSHYLESPEQVTDHDLCFLEHELTGLPPAFVITAGFDPLRDEGQAYVDKLLAADVAVKHVCYTDMIHAFLSFGGGIAAGEHAIKSIAAELNDSFKR